jgi:CRP-like cAMP-binding protein
LRSIDATKAYSLHPPVSFAVSTFVLLFGPTEEKFVNFRGVVGNPLIEKLRAFVPFAEEDLRLLDELVVAEREVEARTDIIQEGDKPSDVHLVMSGFACRYKVLPGGKRNIMAYLIPGDFCDLHVFVLNEMDHSLATLSPCRVVAIPRARILQLLERPAIAKAFWIAALVDEATLREWLVNIGSRPAEERIAHLLCEMLLRLRAVGLANGDRYELPLTQTDLADTMGMSSVHMNRVLQQLRSEKLIEFQQHNLVILDFERLRKFGNFNPNYLHLTQRALAANGNGV